MLWEENNLSVLIRVERNFMGLNVMCLSAIWEKGKQQNVRKVR